jgi:hypothetical protein
MKPVPEGELATVTVKEAGARITSPRLRATAAVAMTPNKTKSLLLVFLLGCGGTPPTGGFTGEEVEITRMQQPHMNLTP